MAHRSSPRRLRRPPWAELAALAAVAVVAVLSWLLVSGTATAVYRSFAAQGDPPLQDIQVPGPDPAAAVAPTPDSHVSQLGHYGYFWSERAFQYRVALMFATDGGPRPAVLRDDTAQQHPDGVDAWREYTLLMEPVYGFLYRLAGDQARPFVEFLLGLIPLIHVLLLFPVYAAARALGAERPAAVGAALVAAACRLGFARLAGSLLLKEDFALLLLLVFTALHLWAWRRQGRILTILAALVLVPLLASWHLAQFLAAALLGGAAVAHLAAGATPARPEAAADDDAGPRPLASWFMPAVYLAAFLLAGLTPSLRERWFVVGPATAVPAAWLAATVLAPRLGAPGRRAAGRVAVLLLLTGGAMAAAYLNPAYGGDYGHVSGLLLAKLRHGLVRPDDPAALSFAVREFWAPPFNTPDLAEVRTGLGLHAILLAAAALWALAAGLGRGATPWRRGFLLIVPVYAAGYVLAARLGVVLLPFAAVAAALMVQALAGRIVRAPGRAGWVAGIALAILSAVNVPLNLAGPVAAARDVLAGRPARLGTSDDVRASLRSELFRWLTRQTPGPGSPLPGGIGAVLTDIGLSPQVLLYTERPVVLNSQFENVEIRRRTQRYLTDLYGDDPDSLHAFCRAMDARFLVVDRTLALADSPGSTAWTAGVTGPLSLAETVVRLHLDPLHVPGFAPLWDNAYYRVFAVLGPGQHADPAAWDTRFSGWWQPANFTVDGGRLTDLAGDRERLAAFEDASTDLQERQAAILAAAARRRAGWPDLLLMQRRLATARLDACLGEVPAADRRAADARLANAVQTMLADVDPATGLSVGQALGRLLDGEPGAARGGAPSADAGWRALLASMRPEPTHRAVAAQLAAMAGRFDEAASGFLRAADRWQELGADGGPAPPMRRQLWDETVLWLAAAGRCDEARRLAVRWAPRCDQAQGPGALVRRVAAAAGTGPAREP